MASASATTTARRRRPGCGVPRGATIATDDSPSRIGTTFSKESAGVVSSSAAPAAPPAIVTGAMRAMKRP